MSTLERRVHLLLAPDQYEQVAEVARRRRTSVGAVIRDAIDLSLHNEDAVKRAAAKRIVDWGNQDDRPAEDWEAAKEELENDLTARLP